MRKRNRSHYNKAEKINRLLEFTSLNDYEAKSIADGLDALTFAMIKEVIKQLRVFARGKE